MDQHEIIDHKFLVLPKQSQNPTPHEVQIYYLTLQRQKKYHIQKNKEIKIVLTNGITLFNGLIPSLAIICLASLEEIILNISINNL